MKRLNIVEQAKIAVPRFDQVAKKLEQQVVLRGQSMSILKNYIRRIALISLHFERLPQEISQDEINEYLVSLICLWNDKLYYNLLFKAVWETLRSFGYTHYGVESGAIAVLHTWGQNLSLHPHIHCIVPAAGFSIKDRWKHIGKEDKYLYPVAQLSAAFKGKFLNALKRKIKKIGHATNFNTQFEKAYQTKLGGLL